MSTHGTNISCDFRPNFRPIFLTDSCSLRRRRAPCISNLKLICLSYSYMLVKCYSYIHILENYISWNIESITGDSEITRRDERPFRSPHTIHKFIAFNNNTWLYMVELSEYEQERLQNIARNNAILKDLDIEKIPIYKV